MNYQAGEEYDGWDIIDTPPPAGTLLLNEHGLIYSLAKQGWINIFGGSLPIDLAATYNVIYLP